MSFWGVYETLDRESVLEWCRLDRDRLTEKMMRRYPQFRGQPPSAWIEDLIVSVCAFRVHDHPLPKGQLGLCDVANKLVLINSTMEQFVGPDVDLEALRCSTLAHELGHIQLHQGEIESQFVSRYGRWESTDDPRTFQRECEADLYAAVFMVPKDLLVLHPKTIAILKARRDEKPIRPSILLKYVYELANAFGVSSTLMRRSLQERGWLEQYGKRGYLRLRFG